MKTKMIKTVGSVYTKTNDKIESNKMSNIIYKVECRDCERVYVGQTSKKLETRMNQHGTNIIRQRTKKQQFRNSRIRFGLKNEHNVLHENEKEKEDEKIKNEIKLRVIQSQSAAVQHAVMDEH